MMSGPDPACTHLVEVAFPGHFATESPKAGLSFYINQKFQAGLDRGPLGLETSGSHSPLDKAIINDDIGTHGTLLSSSCVYFTELYTSLKSSATWQSLFSNETPEAAIRLMARGRESGLSPSWRRSEPATLLL